MKVVGAALLFMVACPELAAAAYLVQGDQEGSFCKGIGTELCEFKSIDATLKGGQLYELKHEYQTVDEFHDGKCWIRIRSGILNRVIGDIPTFLKYNDGPRYLVSSYINLGTPEYIVFSCLKK